MLSIRQDRDGKDWRPAFKALEALIRETTVRPIADRLLAVLNGNEPADVRFNKTFKALAAFIAEE